MISSLKLSDDQQRIDEAEGALEGTVYASYPLPKDNFVHKYMARFGKRPGLSADVAYDTVYLLARAIENAQSFEPALVKKALPLVKLDGASGHLRFDSGRSVMRQPELFVVKGGGAERVR